MLKDTEDVVSNTMICNCGSPHISSTKQEEKTMHNVSRSSGSALNAKGSLFDLNGVQPFSWK
jgi:hypothetical protein